MLHLFKLSSEEIVKFNSRGLFPTPEEKEEHFFKRIQLYEKLFSHPPEKLDDFLTDGDWSQAGSILQELFGFFPDWAIAYFSNEGLSFFEGAATWIYEKENNPIPLIQLKKRLQDRQTLFGLYKKEELLAHEAIHAMRTCLHSPRFEELFAYMSSPVPWRRQMGPLFQEPWQSRCLVILLSLAALSGPLSIFYESLALWGFLPPLLFLLWLNYRLICLHHTLRKALNHLRKILKNPKHAIPLACRLTDEEILHIAKSSPEAATTWMKHQHSLRWRFLLANYPLHSR